MAAQNPTRPYDGKDAFQRLVLFLKERRGIDITKRGQVKAASVELGVGTTTFANWIKRGLPLEQALMAAQAADVDLYYLIGATDHMGAFLTSDPDGKLNRIIERVSELERAGGTNRR